MSSARLAFELPTCLEASAPPEARGVPRDGVRLLVARRSGPLSHATFRDLPRFLSPGDLVVVNASATVPAAIDASARDAGTGSAGSLVVHVSTQLDDGRVVVELRRRDGNGTRRWSKDAPRDLELVGGGRMRLEAPYLGSPRLWIAEHRLALPLLAHLERHGRPIRYGHVKGDWPLRDYQTVYATEPGSAEMPSAGRPFTAQVIAELVARGVGVTPIVLHAGVASLEAGELPFPERASVPSWTAARVNTTRAAGGLVVAVGTTVVRALESAARPDGSVAPFEGWTDLVVGPATPPRVVDALLTGWHEPETSHLLLLESVAGRETLERSYAAALESGYLFHEFGDSHLVLP